MQTYHSISAEVYNIDKPIGSSFGDVEYYSQRLSHVKGKILEPAVGTGRILIPLLEQGLAIEGFDLSEEMLAYCRDNLKMANKEANIFLANMETFQSEQQYEAIIIPAGTFLLIEDDDKAFQILTNFHHHLESNGRLIVDLFLQPDFSEGSSHYRTFTNNQGELITLQVTQSEVNYINQTTTSHHRYDKWKDGKCIESEFEIFTLKWYGINEFKRLLMQIGFRDIVISADYCYQQDPTNRNQVITFEAVK
ncbi:class I SAM-dependent methyltransferase [Lysinibacillus sp. NPDC097162]|uniref:class I SAM-dependent methyltransferase n=1 Tax=Lysinibacillus sp. NPDC097162 TaxID=3364140 RepID=UPI00381B00F6